MTPARVQEGERWVSMLCTECHKNPDSQTLIGPAIDDLPPEFGKWSCAPSQAMATGDKRGYIRRRHAP